MEAQRALLDELMGAERNLAPEQRTQTRKRHFSDRDVDKMYLVGCSPYELFRRTKSDLGPNPKIPDDACKAAWEELSEQEKRRYGYEEETRRFLEKLVRQVDYRIRDNLARSNPEDPEALANTALRILELEDEMDETLERLQALAKQGEVVMAFNLYKRVETLRAQRNVLFSVPDSQRLHIVCPVSGNLISRGDNDERLLSHFTGKQYNGWKLVRAKLEELNKSLARPLDGYAGRSFGFGGGGGGGGGYRGNSRPAPAYDAHPRSYSSFERRGGVDRREYERRFPRGDRDAAASATLARERSADRSQDWGRGRDDESHGRRRRSPSYSRGSRKRGRSDEYDYGDGNDRRSRSRYHYSSGNDDDDDDSDGAADDRDESHGRDRRKSSKKDSKKHKKRHKKHKKHKSSSHKLKKSSSSRHRRRSRSASASSASDSDSDAEVARRLRERQGRSSGRR